MTESDSELGHKTAEIRPDGRINLDALRAAVSEAGEEGPQNRYPHVRLSVPTTLAFIELAEALHPVAAGLLVGDSYGTAWHEWPEYRDIERVAVALAAFDFRASHPDSPGERATEGSVGAEA